MGDNIKFYLILLSELVFFPFLYIKEQISKWRSVNIKLRYRLPVDKDLPVRVVIHEWGGYDISRWKNVNNISSFKCGLKYQMERFANIPNVKLHVTISDSHLFKYKEFLCKYDSDVSFVPNKGMDFAGYKFFYDLVKTKRNSYVILTNSSVNSDISLFLDGYIEYLNANQDVGMLGISYCTSMWQTLIRPNFRPHLQSFFLMTTVDVLNELVSLNHNKFPGCDITNKRLLIRNGEVFISSLVEKLGYRLAVVNPIDGKPYKFESYKFWKLPFGDIRQFVDQPNKITMINND